MSCCTWTCCGNSADNDGDLAGSLASIASLPSLDAMNDDEIRSELLSYGEVGGPVTNSTRRPMMKFLRKLREARAKPLSQKFQPEKFQKWLSLDQTLCCQLETRAATDSSSGRPSSPREYYNYYLLDPRMQNLGRSNENVSEAEMFKAFADSIFYVGKGWGTRPYQHLREAAKLLEGQSDTIAKISDKTRQILDIWHSGNGVCIHEFHIHSTNDEALSREAAMIKAIGLQKLTNAQKGSFFGDSSIEKSKLGAALVFRSYQSFKVTERIQLRLQDVRVEN